MPEAPDLQVIKEVLARRIISKEVVRAKVVRPTVLRSLAGQEFAGDIAGRTIQRLWRLTSSRPACALIGGRSRAFSLAGPCLLALGTPTAMRSFWMRGCHPFASAPPSPMTSSGDSMRATQGDRGGNGGAPPTDGRGGSPQDQGLPQGP